MKKLKKMMAVLLAVVMTFTLVLTAEAVETTADGLSVLPTDADTPSEGCMFLGVEGSYVTQTQEALDLINSYRLEACKEGVTNPSTGEPLTLADYVPIKWSSGLEYIARIRAAESSITVAHARLNGSSWSSVLAPDGTRSYGEVLAWNFSDTMTAGIEQWYGEKSDWANGTEGAETGHYTSMINPNNTYVGLAAFCSGSVRYYNTTAGEFTSGSGLDETQGTAVDSCVQLLEVSESFIDGYGIGIAEDYNACVLYASVNDVAVRVMDGVTWSSSNPDIAVDENSGVLSPSAGGTTTLTASVSGNAVAEAEVTAEPADEPATTEPVTTEPVTTQPDTSVMLGDVDGDGKVTISDVTAIQKALAQIITLTDVQSIAAEVDGSSLVDISDATTIQKYIAKIIDIFPAAG